MRRLEQYWYRVSPLHLALWPLSLAFGAAAALRRAAYRHGLRRVTRLAVPVVVVGNISVGGTGKTPLTLWLAQRLAAGGWHPGIVSRGYGGRACGVSAVKGDDDPAQAGDETVLLARRAPGPVWRGARRAEAAQALLAAHPECDLILCDDGLQHYALARDIEIAVLDGARGCGNGMLLPAGPLREPPGRFDAVDAIVVNGAPLFALELLPHEVPVFDMRLRGSVFYNLRDPAREAGAEDFRDRPLHAAAGIGNPRRFFDRLRELGLSFDAHAFPDHHPYVPGDLDFARGEPLIVTEKDAVKCERFCGNNVWALRADAEVDPALGDLLLQKLDKRR